MYLYIVSIVLACGHTQSLAGNFSKNTLIMRICNIISIKSQNRFVNSLFKIKNHFRGSKKKDLY